MISDEELDGLIEMAAIDDWNYCSPRQMRAAFKELKERRESELRPATRFLDNIPEDQFRHIESELQEVKEALKRVKMCVDVDSLDGVYYDPIDQILDELNDVKISAETMSAILEPNEQRRREAMKQTIAKNAARGYYDEA